MKKVLIPFVLVCSMVILLLACGGGGGGSSSPNVQAPTWQLDGQGFYQFITNDPRYYGNGFWVYFNQDEEPMYAVIATIKKESGSAEGDYGIIFCYKDNSNFYVLLIDTTGRYLIGKNVNGSHTFIISPTVSANLFSGYGVENVVNVYRTGPGTFAIYFNGIQETTFNDSSF
jgi:hypothetical protein